MVIYNYEANFSAVQVNAQSTSVDFSKATYHFVEIDPDTKKIIPSSTFALDVVSSIDFDDPKAIVIYETVGGDGGYAIPTGRKTQTVTITARFISNVPYGNSQTDVNRNTVKQDVDKLNENIKKLKRLRNIRFPVYIYKLNYGAGQGFFGRYLIQNVSGSIQEADTSIPITIKLVEYKELTIDRNVVINPKLPESLNSDVVGQLLTVQNRLV